jgi:hypothetical protein
MRSVWIFPALPKAEAENLLNKVGLRREVSGYGADWVVAGGLFVDLKTNDLFDWWEEEDIAGLTTKIGERPTWGLMVDVSGRMPGYPEVCALLELLIGQAGHAMDDSDGVWTFAEISADSARPGGRRFFPHG